MGQGTSATRAIAATIVVGALALGTARAQQPRDLPVPSDKGWQHADTGIVLTARLDGLARTKLVDTTASERDVVAEFGTGGPVVATVRLFRPAEGGAAMWFDRADAEMRAGALGGATARSAPQAFASPGTTVAGALREVALVRRGAYRTMALAVVPVGDWIAAIRLRASGADAAALDRRLSNIVGAIRWPAAMPPPVAAHAIAACATRMSFGEAKPVATPPAASLRLDAAIADAIGGPSTPRATADWCREGDGNAGYGTYRADGSRSAYLLAVGDAGLVVEVGPSTGPRAGTAEPRYSATLMDVTGGVRLLRTYDARPRPALVAAALQVPPAGG